MKKKDEIIKKYKQNIYNLKIHNDLYFNKDKPKISDDEYDKLKLEILTLESNYKYLKRLNLYKNRVDHPLLINSKRLITLNQCFLSQMRLVKMR